MRIEDCLISDQASLRRVLLSLENAAYKVCVVVKDDGAILRTITDGDIRRALIDGFNLDTKVRDITGKTPITCFQNASQQELISVLDEHQINFVVIVDEDNRPVDLADRVSLLSFLYLSPPHMGSKEVQYVNLAFEENYIAPAGKNLVEFENELMKVSGKTNALALSSGTAGLHLALEVLGVDVGDRVYVSDVTFIASVNPIVYARGIPVLIDSEPDSWNMSPKALARAFEKDIKAGTLPKAIIVVHLYGQSADMDAIMELANKYEVPVIEDAAESLGACYKNKPSGSHGLLGVYSFNGNKIITTSGGGALMSDRTDLIDMARKLSTQGRDPGEHYQHSQIAYNYRMSNVLAGIGRGQIELLKERVLARRRVYKRYVEKLSGIEGISFQGEVDGGTGNRWLSVIKFDPNVIGIHPYVLLREMRRHGFEARPAWKPMHLQPIFLDAEFWPHSPDQVVGSELFFSTLCLPSGSSMTIEQQDKVISCVERSLSGVVK